MEEKKIKFTAEERQKIINNMREIIEEDFDDNDPFVNKIIDRAESQCESFDQCLLAINRVAEKANSLTPESEEDVITIAGGESYEDIKIYIGKHRDIVIRDDFNIPIKMSKKQAENMLPILSALIKQL